MCGMAPLPPPPPLAVVIPTHETRELTLRCLDSLVSGFAGALAVVVVDDGSRDGTAEAIASRHPGVTILRNPQPAGFTRSANRGLGHAREHGGAPLLLLLNSDTEMPAGSLEALLASLRAAPRLGIAGAALHYPGGSPQWSGGREPSLAWLFALASGLPALLERLPFYRRAKPLLPKSPRRGAAASPDLPARRDWVTGAAMAIRAEVWDAVGPMDEEFRFYAQDLDFCSRARRAGWEVAVAPRFRVLHHHGATIGREPGAIRRQHPELLWADLLLWARKHRGPAWAGRAERALRLGCALRLAIRRLAAPWLPAERREALDEDSRALRAAREALRAPH
jgi:N-acetylglucosaminyl-diphospho-decaprenol L-rhamnosyltransferase